MEVERNMYLSFSEKLWQVLGFDASCAGEDGSNRKIGSVNRDVKCPGFVDMHVGLHSLWVYSDCCGHRAVGGVRAPLLRTVKLKSSESGDVVHRVFTRPYYVAVSQSFMPSLEVFITDNTGQKVPFFPGELVGTLHFRPRSVIKS